MRAMLKRTYDWCIDAADKPYALWILAAVSFAESSFFPIPPDIMLLPMSLARPKKAWWFATVCTIASVAGGVLGYAIGALLYDSIGQWLITLYGLSDKVETFRASYAEWGAVIILLKGLTPIPYKLVTITSGFAGYNIWLFVLCSIVARGGRFFVVADPAQPLRRPDPERTGKAARPVGRHRRRCTGARLLHRVQADLDRVARCISRFGLRLRGMSDRPARVMLKSFGTQLATAGLVASMLATAPEAGWPQAAPPPTLGLQSPAQQPAPAQPEPQQIEPPQAAARRESGPDQRDRQAVREIQIAAAAAEEPERDHRRFQRAHQGRRPEPVEHGQALDHGERAGGVSRVRPTARRTARPAPTGCARARATRKARASTPMRPRNARRKCICRATSASRATARPKIT